ncbi:MAG TPA: hypothetical protein H9685_06705 [Firmicutes bacterium]|nr:hypothetical protein [Bacillota bacterium]
MSKALGSRLSLFFAAVLVLAAVVIYSPGVSARSITEDQYITNVAVYTGTLYLSDMVENKIILKNVKPVIEDEHTLQVAADIEYTATDLFADNIYNDKGEQLDPESLNWYLDMDVKVVVAEMNIGYKVMSVVTL